jgi:type IV secretory pathway VirJ component
MKRAALLVFSLLLVVGAGTAMTYRFVVPGDHDLMPLDRMAMPKGVSRGVVFLLSDAAGWGAQEDKVSRQLQADGIVVVGVDTPRYLATIAGVSDSCTYLVADIERLSQQFQRQTGAVDYVAPVVAGIGLGGGLALDIVDQTPAATVGGTAVVDPVSAVPLAVELCTPAGYLTTAQGEIYALHPGPQVDPVSILLTPTATGDIRARATAFKAGSPDVMLAETARPTPAAVAALIEARVAGAKAVGDALPITVLNTAPRHDAMAIILSGDGGWRDIDASIGKALQADGVPVVGLDSLRYFWSKRDPQHTARDIATLIRKYRAAWGVRNVILVGYSFGADVLPATYLALPQAEQRQISLISLLGLSTAADWHITVSGWLGSHGDLATPTLPVAVTLPLAKVQCVYGVNEENAACPALGQAGAALLRMAGGHHFGGNYGQVEQAILAAYTGRSGEGDMVEPGEAASLSRAGIGPTLVTASATLPLIGPRRAPTVP